MMNHRNARGRLGVAIDLAGRGLENSSLDPLSQAHHIHGAKKRNLPGDRSSKCMGRHGKTLVYKLHRIDSRWSLYYIVLLHREQESPKNKHLQPGWKCERLRQEGMSSTSAFRLILQESKPFGSEKENWFKGLPNKYEDHVTFRNRATSTLQEEDQVHFTCGHIILPYLSISYLSCSNVVKLSMWPQVQTLALVVLIGFHW